MPLAPVLTPLLLPPCPAVYPAPLFRRPVQRSQPLVPPRMRVAGRCTVPVPGGRSKVSAGPRSRSLSAAMSECDGEKKEGGRKKRWGFFRILRPRPAGPRSWGRAGSVLTRVRSPALGFRRISAGFSAAHCSEGLFLVSVFPGFSVNFSVIVLKISELLFLIFPLKNSKYYLSIIQKFNSLIQILTMFQSCIYAF